MLVRGGLAASILSWAINPYAHPAASGETRHPAVAQSTAQHADDDVEPSADDAEDNEAPAVPADSAPAVRYAALDRSSCEAELTRRAVPFTRVPEARGVLAPVRLTGALHGVTYRSGLSARQRATAPIEVVDCRLVLSLDDFAAILARHDVVEVIHMSAWRPPPARGWTAGKLGRRHGAAMAMDMGTFRKKDGTDLRVERDFHGRIGSRTCGARTGPWPATPQAVEMRQIVCEAASARLFNVALTPNYNRPHRNHFHLEVTPRVRWFITR